MNTAKQIRSVAAGAAVIAAIGLTAGLAPASAAPRPSPGVTLGIADDPANSANYLLTIRGLFP